jgi:hypothetical protein
MLRQNRGATAAVAITVLVTAGLAGPVDAHSLTKTIFAPTDDSVLFTHDFGEKGSIPVIYDRSRSTNHAQYYCRIQPHDPTIARPLISTHGWCADSLTGEAVTRIPPGEYSFLEPWTVDCRHVVYADCQAAQPGIDEIELTVTDASLYSCGFDPSLSDLPCVHGPFKPSCQ